MQPETKYARLGGDRIAYQVLGEGPPDLILARRQLRAHRHRLGGPRDQLVPPTAGVVLPADPVQPARHGGLRPPPARLPAPLGVVRRGTGGGLGRGRLRAGGDHGGARRGPDRVVVCRDQAGAHQRPCPGAHLGQVHRRQRLPDRGCTRTAGGGGGPVRPVVGHRRHGRAAGTEPSRRRALPPLVRQGAARQREP